MADWGEAPIGHFLIDGRSFPVAKEPYVTGLKRMAATTTRPKLQWIE